MGLDRRQSAGDWANEELISGGPLDMVVVEVVDDLAVAEVLAQTERRAEVHGVTFRASGAAAGSSGPRSAVRTPRGSPIVPPI